jgi:hypothetical protein
MAACGPWIFLAQSPQLIAVLAGLHPSQAAYQVENVLRRELAVFLPFQAGWLDGALEIRQERNSKSSQTMESIDFRGSTNTGCFGRFLENVVAVTRTTWLRTDR